MVFAVPIFSKGFGTNRKHGSSSFSHLFNCVCFILVWSIKVHIKDQIDLFLNFKLLNFLVRTIQCTETLILYLFFYWPWRSNWPKDSKSTKSIWLFILIGIYNFVITLLSCFERKIEGMCHSQYFFLPISLFRIMLIINSVTTPKGTKMRYVL